RRDQVPVQVRRHPPVDVPPVDPAGQRLGAVVVVLRPVLARPQRLARVGHIGRYGTVALRAEVPARVVAGQHVDRVAEGRVAGHLVRAGPGTGVQVRDDELHAVVPVGVQRVAYVDGEVDVPLLLVLRGREVVDGQVVLLGTSQPGQV